MLELRRPGMYVERAPAAPVLAPLRSDIAAFAGRARRGPLGVAVRLEGWREFQQMFGGLDATAYLGYALRGYFENGGEIGYALRVGREAPEAGTVLASDFSTASAPAAAAPAPVMAVRAASPGGWANDARVLFSLRFSGANRPPRLSIRVQPMDEPDEFIGAIALDPRELALEPGDPDVDPLVRAIANRSNLIRVDTTLAVVIAAATRPRVDWQVTLVNGRDGRAEPADYEAALTVLCDQPEPALLGFPDIGLDLQPGARVALQIGTLARCEELKDRVLLTEVPASADVFNHPALDIDNTTLRAQELRPGEAAEFARSAGFYHPWLRVQDPLGGAMAPLRDVPPCGHVAGLVSRSDRERGASCTPANLPLYDAVDVSRAFPEAVESEFNRRGINIIRCLAGEGLKIWGGGTLARGSEADSPHTRFIAHRRLINRLVRAIRRVAEPLVFDNNGPELWLAVYRGANSVLFEAFQHGALKGARPEEGYRIRCDASINTPETIDLGQVLCEIGIAPAAPMEFILLRLAFAGDGRLEVFES